MVGPAVLTAIAVVLGICHGCIQLLDGWKQVSVEERARRAQVVFHGLAITTIPDANPVTYSAQFWIINVYKGAETMASLLNVDPGNGGVLNIRDRRVNVTKFGAKAQCYPSVVPQKYYIVFSERKEAALSAKYDDLFGATTDWTEENEDLVWTGVGWEQWSDWSACSSSCAEGTQERRRFCRESAGCHGYNKERRRCNMFSCQGAVDPLSLEDRRFFHPSRGQWERVPGRTTAWRLRPNSYIWVPSSELFPGSGPNKAGSFPREFTLLITLRLHQQNRAQGTVFSVRSRRQQEAYLSVELNGVDSVKVVHAGANGTQSVEIPAPLGDGNWHQLALGLHDDSSVRSYMDCRWVSTDILKRNSLDIPEDADIVIGYLFLGDLEQLMIVPSPTAVSQQCSASRIPLLDPTLLLVSTEATRPRERRGRKAKGHKGEEHRHDPPVGTSSLPPPQYEPEENYEGSGTESNDITEGQYEVEWSEWSPCSSSCGTGAQSRYSRCVDDGSRLELCMEAGGERTETRACSRACPEVPALEDTSPATNTTDVVKKSRKRGKLYQSFKSHKNTDRKIPRTPKRMRAHQVHGAYNTSATNSTDFGQTGNEAVCPDGCSNGGTCVLPGHCRCLPGFSGPLCRQADCASGCQNGGRCMVVGPGQGRCSCATGWTGGDCGSPMCEPECRFGGQCVRPHACHCPPGTSGPFCQNFSCRHACLNGGACVGPDQCECPHDWSGAVCEEPVCDPCCENGGSCSPGNRCLCGPGSTGTRCEKRMCEYREYQEPYTRRFRRLVSRRYETKCEPSSWKTCVRTQPEYQTVYKTFYRTVYKCAENHP